MKDLQFRLWDKKRGEMINLRPAELSNVQGAHIALAFEEYGHTRSDETERIEDYELMQFTGLRDKNGKEIFEGHICKRNGKIYLIECEENSLILCMNEISKRRNHGKGTGNVIFHNTALLDSEIIGNIYENPELL